MPTTPATARLTAVLGPTNTGKTYLAMERLAGHASGMIGFPLRLLARENYDRLVAIKGDSLVALVTGEEKIVPPTARYFVCTVEAMPADRDVAFLAVDEVQLAADRERGHVFTDRLIHARGREETMFLGAATIRPLLSRLLPGIEIIERPRFSTLSYGGEKKLGRLPRRSAAVAFSANDVYGLAEVIRRQRGGAAVVMGALSPRTRNAQVALYQSGDVDYLVATDAIGMGLNMDLHHVALAARWKFDGERRRPLSPAEIGQIAGRAGRHMHDGTFGTTAGCERLEPETIAAVESHEFERIDGIYWRNRELDFASVPRLLESLNAPPPASDLWRAPDSDDVKTLRDLAKLDGIAARATGRDAVTRLWAACQIPEFHQTHSDAHTRLVGRVFEYLMSENGLLPAAWMNAQLARLDRVDGDIETLMGRLAQIRIWTYISHRQEWLEDGPGWQERARQLEDRLSDALHQGLTQRFVDRRTSVLLQKLNAEDNLNAEIGAEGEVLVENLYVGKLAGFRFGADLSSTGEDARALVRAARQALRGEIVTRLQGVRTDTHDAFSLAPDGGMLWRGERIARLARGPEILRPRVEILPSDLLEAGERDIMATRLAAWVDEELRRHLAPLFRLTAASLTGSGRGLAFQLCETLGTLRRSAVIELVRELSKEQRRDLNRAGVRIGSEAIYVDGLQGGGASLTLRALLWRVFHETFDTLPLPPDGRMSFHPETLPGAARTEPDDQASAFYQAAGYLRVGPVFLRADILNRLGQGLWQATHPAPEPASHPPTPGPATAEPPEAARDTPPETPPGMPEAAAAAAAGGAGPDGAEEPAPEPAGTGQPAGQEAGATEATEATGGTDGPPARPRPGHPLPADLLSQAGLKLADAPGVFEALGYELLTAEDTPARVRHRPRRKARKHGGKQAGDRNRRPAGRHGRNRERQGGEAPQSEKTAAKTAHGATQKTTQKTAQEAAKERGRGKGARQAGGHAGGHAGGSAGGRPGWRSGGPAREARFDESYSPFAKLRELKFASDAPQDGGGRRHRRQGAGKSGKAETTDPETGGS